MLAIAGLGYHLVSGRDPTSEERFRHPRLIRFDADVEYPVFRSNFDSLADGWLTARSSGSSATPPSASASVAARSRSRPSSPRSMCRPSRSAPSTRTTTQHAPNENLRVFDFLQGISIMAAVQSQSLE